MNHRKTHQCMHDFFIKLVASTLKLQLMAGKSRCQNNLYRLLFKQLSQFVSIQVVLESL